MEELEKGYIEEKAKKFRINDFKPLGFFSKLFNVCYSNFEVDKLLSKAIILKEMAEDKIKCLKEDLRKTSNELNKTLEANEELKSVLLTNSNLEKDLELQKEKYVKEVRKLSKTINELTYSKTNLEEEIKGLRHDLNECNAKHQQKVLNNNKENTAFIDRLLKKNEKLNEEIKDMKLFLKKKKITFEKL